MVEKQKQWRKRPASDLKPRIQGMSKVIVDFELNSSSHFGI
jgi:hypothetical protein